MSSTIKILSKCFHSWKINWRLFYFLFYSLQRNFDKILIWNDFWVDWKKWIIIKCQMINMSTKLSYMICWQQISKLIDGTCVWLITRNISKYESRALELSVCEKWKFSGLLGRSLITLGRIAGWSRTNLIRNQDTHSSGGARRRRWRRCSFW